MKPYKRQFFKWTDFKFQRDFIFLCVFTAAISCAIVMTALWFAVNELRTTLELSTGDQPMKLDELIASQGHMAITFAVLACAVNILTVAIFAFVFSTRVSGILLRLTNELNRFADGQEVRKIKPRANDFFQDLVTAANRLFKD